MFHRHVHVFAADKVGADADRERKPAAQDLRTATFSPARIDEH